MLASMPYLRKCHQLQVVCWLPAMFRCRVLVVASVKIETGAQNSPVAGMDAVQKLEDAFKNLASRAKCEVYVEYV